MLYTVNKSPFGCNNLVSMLRVAPENAPVLLFEDGVYGAIPGSSSEALIRDAMRAHQVYALDADLEARGIAKVIEGITVIGYDGFVALVEEHDVVPWL